MDFTSHAKGTKDTKQYFAEGKRQRDGGKQKWRHAVVCTSNTHTIRRCRPLIWTELKKGAERPGQGGRSTSTRKYSVVRNTVFLRTTTHPSLNRPLVSPSTVLHTERQPLYISRTALVDCRPERPKKLAPESQYDVEVLHMHKGLNRTHLKYWDTALFPLAQHLLFASRASQCPPIFGPFFSF